MNKNIQRLTTISVPDPKHLFYVEPVRMWMSTLLELHIFFSFHEPLLHAWKIGQFLSILFHQNFNKEPVISAKVIDLSIFFSLLKSWFIIKVQILWEGHEFEKIPTFLSKLLSNVKTKWEIFVKFSCPSQNIWTLLDQNKLDPSKTIGARTKLFWRSKITLDP